MEVVEAFSLVSSLNSTQSHVQSCRLVPDQDKSHVPAVEDREALDWTVETRHVVCHVRCSVCSGDPLLSVVSLGEVLSRSWKV